MSISKISPDDPRLTAYALGELEGEDRAAVEAALRDDPAAQAAVAEIRATVAKLEFTLAAEPMVPPVARPKARKSRVLRFPQAYFVIGGLAAACFAVMVALRPVAQPESARRKVYTEFKLEQPAADKPLEQAAGSAAESPKEETVVAANAAAPATVMSSQPAPDLAAEAKADRLSEIDAARRTRSANEVMTFSRQKKELELEGGTALAVQSKAKRSLTYGSKETEVVTLSPFEVRDAKDRGYLMTRKGDSRERVAGFMSGQTASTETYAYRPEADYLGAAENPLSTFSIDVDTASYANVRRIIRSGMTPSPDAVRVEELVNYFPYRYAPPTGDAPFAASMEVADAPWAPTHRLVRIGLKGREVATAARPPANLVFLLDVSGSMDEPNKLPLVKESMRLLVSKLRPDDRVAIVVYAGASGLALPSTPVKQSREILAALDELTPGGSTNGAMGIQLAYDIAKANFVPGGVNRVILCTDGDFNVGVTGEGDLVRLIREKAKSGVFLTALGFGMGNLKDATLEQLADKGNGNYGYIDSRREAEKLLVEQVNGTLLTIAKDVKLQVEFNPAQVTSYRLIGYEDRMLKKEDFNNDAVDAGEIGAGHTVTALYEVVPTGLAEKSATTTPAVDELKYRKADTGNRRVNSSDNPQSNELLTLKVRYKEPAGEKSVKLEFPLVDAGASFAKATTDFKFAAAVAEFGMILRHSPHAGTGTLHDVITWAEAGNDADAGGYRGEFIELVKQAATLVQ